MAAEAARSPLHARTVLRWIATGLVAVLAVAFGAFLLWALTPLGPTDDALAALESGRGVQVDETGDGWVFTPLAGSRPTTGLVFYPGGRVDARSYAPFARDLAMRGHRVAIAKVPLSLAVLDPDAADDFIGAPGSGVTAWAVGGHSLGGVMAARYAASHQGPVSALLLLASYPAGEPDGAADLSDAPIAVVDITATEDSVLNMNNWGVGQALLPVSTEHVVIEGGNHAQFGSYGEQPGDSPATITPAEQRAQTVDAADALLRRFAQAP